MFLLQIVMTVQISHCQFAFLLASERLAFALKGAFQPAARWLAVAAPDAAATAPAPAAPAPAATVSAAIWLMSNLTSHTTTTKTGI